MISVALSVILLKYSLQCLRRAPGFAMRQRANIATGNDRATVHIK